MSILPPLLWSLPSHLWDSLNGPLSWSCSPLLCSLALGTAGSLLVSCERKRRPQLSSVVCAGLSLSSCVPWPLRRRALIAEKRAQSSGVEQLKTKGE